MNDSIFGPFLFVEHRGRGSIMAIWVKSCENTRQMNKIIRKTFIIYIQVLS